MNNFLDKVFRRGEPQPQPRQKVELSKSKCPAKCPAKCPEPPNGGIQPVYGKDEVWAHPHYMDKRFAEERVVFGVQEEDLSWEYSDRLCQYDRQRYEKAEHCANQYARRNTARWAEILLQVYYGDPQIEVVCATASFMWHNGHPYYCYGFRQSPSSAPATTD